MLFRTQLDSEYIREEHESFFILVSAIQKIYIVKKVHLQVQQCVLSLLITRHKDLGWKMSSIIIQQY